MPKLGHTISILYHTVGAGQPPGSNVPQTAEANVPHHLENLIAN